jgi:hypothetical protein
VWADQLREPIRSDEQRDSRCQHCGKGDAPHYGRAISALCRAEKESSQHNWKQDGREQLRQH